MSGKQKEKHFFFKYHVIKEKYPVATHTAASIQSASCGAGRDTSRGARESLSKCQINKERRTQKRESRFPGSYFIRCEARYSFCLFFLTLLDRRRCGTVDGLPTATRLLSRWPKVPFRLRVVPLRCLLCVRVRAPCLLPLRPCAIIS